MDIVIHNHKRPQWERRVTMKRLLKKLENIYSAAAFAEAGEFDTAREIMKEEHLEKRDQKRKRPKKQMRAPGMKR